MQIPILNENERYYVYEHLRADNGKVFYVGKGSNKRAFVSSKHHRNEYWQRVVKKAGGFFVRFVAECMSEELAFIVEIERINQLRRIGVILCNLTDGGDGVVGCKRTEEWKKRIGDAHRGKTISNEVREKISKSVKLSGYAHSEEVRLKISNTHKGHKRSLGYKHTPETLEAMSKSRIGNKSRLGQKRSDEERAKSSASLKGRIQKKQTCPHCGKVGGNAMKMHHFDFCKERK